MNKVSASFGYTLAEVLVAISIFMLIATVGFVNIRYANKNEDLRVTARELTLHFREMQSSALNGKVYNTSVPKGYGIFFANKCSNNCSYKLFADIDGNFKFDKNIDGVIAEYSFPASIALLGAREQGDAPYFFDFSVPSSQFYFQGSESRANIALILQRQGTLKCWEVTVEGINGFIADRSSSCEI